MTVAYPLHWPMGLARYASQMTNSRMKSSISAAVENVYTELRRFGKDTGQPVTDVVISSNCSLGSTRPSDPGVAVYFRWDKIDCCVAIDRYTLPENNLQAVALILAAERSKIRHGGLNIVRAAMRGYAALPPPTGPDGQLAPPWWAVLGFESEKNASLVSAETIYRSKVKTAHPDVGGDAAKFNQLTEAIRQAREILS